MTKSSSENPTPHRSALKPGLLTLVGLAVIGGMLLTPVLAGGPEARELGQWGRFLGRFHPLVLHLPIGMLVLLLLMETGKFFKKDKGGSSQMAVLFTAASAVVAVIFGFLLHQSRPGEYNEELIQSHLRWGIGFACAMVAAYVLKVWVDHSGGRGSGLYFATLVGSSVVMTVASHDGGSLTHGRGFLTAEAPPEVRRLINLIPGVEKLPIEQKPDEVPDGGGDEKAPELQDEQVVYTHLIQPIFDQKCVSCHGEEKQKGRLRMDSFEALLAGGKEGDAFEPGNAEDSNIVYRMHLPEDDDEHMPPEGKAPVEPHELAVIEWWINSGASPDLKVADADMPEEIKVAVAKLKSVEKVSAD